MGLVYEVYGFGYRRLGDFGLSIYTSKSEIYTTIKIGLLYLVLIILTAYILFIIFYFYNIS